MASFVRSLPALVAFAGFLVFRSCSEAQDQTPGTPGNRPAGTGTTASSAKKPNEPGAPGAPGAESNALPPSSNEGHLLLGNPSGAALEEDNYLLSKPQYALSYNRAKGGPNWVSWHVDRGDIGGTDRGKFRADSLIPASWRIEPNDYRGSGYDRGHICPSGDRTNSREDNDATFTMTNMLPQIGALNREVWADLEVYVRSQVLQGNEVYQMAGGTGSLGTIARGKVNIPAQCWKVVLVLPLGQNDLSRVKTSTRVIAVQMPNEVTPQLQKGNWRQFRTSVDEIETATGLDLLSELPDELEAELEKAVDKR